MKFDVVVGNPPYQSPTKNAKRWPLWMKFLRRAEILTKDKGFVGFITPLSWLAPNAAFDVVSRNNVSYVNLNIEKYFDVGSTFSAYVFQKVSSENNNKRTVFISSSGETTFINWTGMRFLPTDPNKITMSLFQKFYFSGKQCMPIKVEMTNHHLRDHVSRVKTDEHCFEIFHTNAQNLWSSIKNKTYDLPKVLMTLSGYQKPFYSDQIGTSQIGTVILVRDELDGQRLVKILNSRLYQHMMKLAKYSGFALMKVLTRLPAVDLSRTWTDEELYEYFGLTQEEINYIERAMK